MSKIILREISSNFDQPEYARQFFEWCDENAVHVQHIVFSAEEFQHFLDYREQGVIAPVQHRRRYVLCQTHYCCAPVVAWQGVV